MIPSQDPSAPWTLGQNVLIIILWTLNPSPGFDLEDVYGCKRLVFFVR